MQVVPSVFSLVIVISPCVHVRSLTAENWFYFQTCTNTDMDIINILILIIIMITYLIQTFIENNNKFKEIVPTYWRFISDFRIWEINVTKENWRASLEQTRGSSHWKKCLMLVIRCDMCQVNWIVLDVKLSVSYWCLVYPLPPAIWSRWS